MKRGAEWQLSAADQINRRNLRHEGSNRGLDTNFGSGDHSSKGVSINPADPDAVIR
jgi:hypothetical protein